MSAVSYAIWAFAAGALIPLMAILTFYKYLIDVVLEFGRDVSYYPLGNRHY